MRRAGLRSVSAKRLKSGTLRYGSTFAVGTLTAADRANGMLRRSTTLARVTPIAKANPTRQAKRDREYQRKLALYRRSETHRIVEERCQGRCEFFVAIVDGVRVARVTPKAGFVPCEHERTGHHHRRYGRQFGGNERPEDMRAGCTPCHDYIEWLKLVHRRRRRSA